MTTDRERDELVSRLFDLAEEGWTYASDYFRAKHRSEERLAELRAALAPPSTEPPRAGEPDYEEMARSWLRMMPKRCHYAHWDEVPTVLMSLTDIVRRVAHEAAKAREDRLIVWLRTVLRLNRNAQELADAIEHGEHLETRDGEGSPT